MEVYCPIIFSFIALLADFSLISSLFSYRLLPYKIKSFLSITCPKSIHKWLVCACPQTNHYALFSSSLSLSAIIAINSLFVGFPLAAEMVYPKIFSTASCCPRPPCHFYGMTNGTFYSAWCGIKFEGNFRI